MISFYRMFLSVFLIMCCISMIESNTCDISKEKSTISSMLQSIEKKMKDSCKLTADKNCPAGWKKYKDHCYYFSQETKIWHDAAKQCNNMGGYLVKIEDSAENSWVVSKVYESVKHKYGSWIGMADFKKEGDWRWVHDSSKVVYSQWYPGEPNNTGSSGNEDCGQLCAVVKYKWNDARCNHENTGYICECSHGPNCRPHNG